ncbi:hypothetical protein ES705_36925 [subsurface metagenome]
MLEYIKKLITPDMISFWVPGGKNRAMDLIRGNHGKVIGADRNVPTIAPPIDQISACDAVTDWEGTDLSIDEADKKEGSGSLKDTVASPVVDTDYSTTYDLTGIWDWSAKKHILFWLKCDRASTAFTSVRLLIADTLGSWRLWYLTFSAGEWTAVKKLLLTGDTQSATPPNLALINFIQIKFTTADEVAFYKKIDDVRVTGYPSLINTAVGWEFGGDDYIDCGNDKSLLRDAFSYSTWIKPIPKFDNVLVGFKSGSTHPSIAISGINDYKALVWLGLSNYKYFCEDNPVRYFDGKWHFVTFVITGNEQADINDSKMFIDGQTQLAYSTLATSGTSSKTEFMIGESSGRYYKGYQCMPILSDVLSLEQHTNIWLATKGMFAPRG